MKRILSLLLVFVLLLGVLPMGTVSAATYSGNVGSLKWSLDTATGKLTISGNGAMPNYEKAYSYGWFDYEEYIKTVSISEGVTSIGDYAFYSYPNLTKMSLNRTVTSIGQYAFYNCDALTTTDTGSVQSLGACAFYGCDGLTSVSVSGQTTTMGSAAYASCKNLATVIVGNGAYIGDSAFSGCTKLSTVYFSTEVSTIGSNAFASCPIETITLPAGLKTIGGGAFSTCTKLTSVTIPANVSYIGENPFQNCNALTGIYVADGNQYYKSVSGVLYDIGGTTILSYPEGKTSSSFYAESTVNSVAPKAFYGCTNLGYVTFSSDLTKIGKSAFENCYGLLSVSFSGTVQTVSELAFSGCTKLRSISLSGVELIDKNAFDTCKSMTSLSIEGSPKIADEAFAQCYALCYLDLGDTYEIGYRAFYETALRAFTLPASVRLVGREAFGYCLDMTTITVLNPGCKFYGTDYAETFWGYDDAVYTFHGYENSSVKAYADLFGHNFTAHSFDENEKCTRCGCEPYTYDDGFWSYEAASGVAYIYGFGETVSSYHYNGPQSWQDFNYAITALVMGNDVKVINGSAFQDQKAMETLNLVNVEEIKPGAFYGCTSLERLYLPDTLVTLGEQAFSGCTSLLSAVLRPNVESVGYNAFSGCSTLLEVDVLNPNCYISDYQCTLGDPEITTIFGFVPSTAYDYATKYGYQFVALDGCEYGYHNYEVINSTPAGCEAAGEVVYKCTGCEESYSEVLEPLGHDMAEEITPPTCTQQGYTLHFCLRCGYSYQDTYIEPNDHNYIGVTTMPTCAEGGYTEYTCHGCGDSYTADYTDPLGHNYMPWIAEPKCTEGGYTEYTCQNCGDHYITDYTDPLGHDYQAQLTMPTCTEGGYTFYVCLNCNDGYTADYTEPTGHEYIAFVTDPSCYEGGYTTYSCLYCNDSYTSDYTEATGHIYEAYVQYPTCSEGGYTNYFCHGCGDSYTADYTEPTGHIYRDGYCIDCGQPDPKGEAPDPAVFSDVSSGSWYKAAVDYAVANGLMNGTGNHKFEPNTPMSRAMLVTVLWRYEGEILEGTNSFTDVRNGQWYTEAVAWAAYNGIVGGVGNNRFDPDGKITREQLATILFRYCNSKGIDTAARADLSSFPDGSKVSAYARDALSWAVAVGLVTGTQNGSRTYLDPQGNATRAQVATILMRFIENVASGSTEAPPSGSGYGAVLREAMEAYGSNAEGLLYDIDGNGVLELVLIFLVPADSDDPYSMPATAYSVYTMQGETVVPLMENQTLYAHAGGSGGWVGVVEMDGDQFFAAYDDGGEVGWWYGGWEIYRISGTGMGLQTAVDFLQVTDENGAIDYAQSYAIFNGERFGYEAYESWVSSVTQISSIDGFGSNLEALLAQLS